MNGLWCLTGLLVLAWSSVSAANLLKNGDFAHGLEAWRTNIRISPEKGGASFRALPGNGKNKQLLWQPLQLKNGAWYRLSFRIRCEKNGVVRTVYQQEKAPYSGLGLARNFHVKAGMNELAVCFQASRRPEENGKLLFNFSLLQGAAALSGIQLEEVDGFQNLTVRELNPVWRISASGAKRSEKMPEGGFDLAALFPGRFRPDASVAYLENRFEAKHYGILKMTVVGDWYFDVSLNGKRICKTTHADRFSKEAALEVEVKPGTNVLKIAARAGKDGWKCNVVEPYRTFVFRENAEWKPYRFESNIVLPGSALDLSSQVPRPAGAAGRLTVGADGSFVFEKEPEVPVRLLGTNGIGLRFDRPAEEFRSNARRFAQQARRLGYRIIRTHGYLDRMCLNTGADLKIDPEMLNRWDILIDELKKEGVYLHFTLLSFILYGDSEAAMKDRRYHKLMAYLDGEWETARLDFAANALFRHVNPYTGLAWKNEPAIAIVEYYNEQELGLNFLPRTLKEYPAARERLKELFAKWQMERYGNITAELPVNLSGPDREREAEFWFSRARISARKFGEIVRAAGYPGLVAPYSFSKSLGHCAARWEFADVGDCHAYFQHPTNWSRSGSVVASGSSISAGADYWRSSFGTRLAGRPFIVSEYNHCYWNPYRYETGLLFGAYSAFQGGGALMIHSGGVEVGRPGRVSCFNVAHSPLMLAGQFLTAQLFQRGDVRRSAHRVTVPVTREYMRRNGNSLLALDNAQTMLAFLSGFSVEFPEVASAQKVPPPKADLRIPPFGVSNIFSHGWFSSVTGNGSSDLLQKTVAQMKAKGILSPENKTAPERGIFESDTGELLMDCGGKQLLVTTPRTEAAAVVSGESIALKTVSILRSSIPACVALSSVDNRPLASSSRMVLVYQTEDANAGMVLGGDRATLHALGSRPILCRTGKLSLNAKLKPADWRLFALGPDGSRREELPAEYRDGVLSLTIDTASLKSGPTVFFELAATKGENR